MDWSDSQRRTPNPLTDAQDYFQKTPDPLTTSSPTSRRTPDPLTISGEPYQRPITSKPQAARLKVITSAAPLNPVLLEELIRSFVCQAESLILEIALTAEYFSVSVLAPAEYVDHIERIIRGIYKGWEVQLEELPILPRASLKLSSPVTRPDTPDSIPIKDISEFKDIDPLQSIVEAAMPLEDDEQLIIRYQIRPMNEERRGEAKKQITTTIPWLTRILLGISGDVRLPKYGPQPQKLLEDRLEQLAFELSGDVILVGTNRWAMRNKAHSLATVFIHRFDNGFGGLYVNDWYFGAYPNKVSFKWPEQKESVYITTSELASLWHFPSTLVQVPGASKHQLPDLPADRRLLKSKGPALGTHRERSKTYTVPLPINSLEYGALVCLGSAGQGKSTLLEQLVYQLANRIDNPTIICIDPHGTLVRNIAQRSIPEHREKDTELIEVGNTDYPVSLPMFATYPGRSRNLQIETIFNTFKTIFQDSWSATRMETAIWNITATLCYQPQPTLLDVSDLLTNPAFRNRALARVEDDEVLKYWDNNFNNLSKSEQAQIVNPIISRLSSLYRSVPVRNILCTKVGPNIMDWPDSGKIILISLAGEEIASASDIIGEIILAKVKLALMSRLSRDDQQHKRVYFVIDESHRYRGATLPALLSEARKTSNSLILATQHLSKWSEQLVDSVLGNLNVFLAFKCGLDDSRTLAPIFHPLSSTDLANLGRHQLIAKLQLDDNTTLPPVDIMTNNIDRDPDEARLKRIRDKSRAIYTNPEATVIDGTEDPDDDSPPEPDDSPDDELYEN
jgi:hypothetical protein